MIRYRKLEILIKVFLARSNKDLKGNYIADESFYKSLPGVFVIGGETSCIKRTEV